jgi:hypothetical protein
MGALVALLAIASCGGVADDAAGPSRSSSSSVTSAPVGASQSPRAIPHCSLVPGARVSAVLGKPVSDEAEYGAIFVLPSLPQIKAKACSFTLTGEKGVVAVSIRAADHDVDAIFSRLASFTTPGLSSIEARAPATSAYWQSIGSTLWLRAGDRLAVAVELITDQPSATLQSRAMQIGLAVLAH